VGEHYRFGPFEFDAGSGEVRRLDGAGPVQRLPPQPARLLGLLVQRQGAVVSRDEIREQLWPDTHVDFDGSLHFCIRQVRAALGDSAADPRYVENVPRRGYRLVPEASRVLAAEAEQLRVRPSRRRVWVLAATAVLVAFVLAYAVVEQQATPPVRIAIMPFEPPADMVGSEQWRPIAEWILVDLSAMVGSAAGIVGPTTTTAYKSSDAGLRRLADDYDLEYILNGRFLGGDSGPRLLAELIRVSDGSHVWVRAYDDLTGGQRLGQEISRNVVRVLELGGRTGRAGEEN
jgi:DNA-binding winged helix-turn-helix (wHTH) protein/TolB-like protein